MKKLLSTDLLYTATTELRRCKMKDANSMQKNCWIFKSGRFLVNCRLTQTFFPVSNRDICSIQGKFKEEPQYSINMLYSDRLTGYTVNQLVICGPVKQKK